ncbi:haloalkane dehalogenase [Vulcanimicrobium alpinum]|nr:haloalkane dehalogenase [Vulcanimicrobium alpinum]
MTRRTAARLIAASTAAVAAVRPFHAEAAPSKTISPVDPHPRKRVTVLDASMSYVEVGSGDPIVLLHGNPTWSYLWRNVISGLHGTGRLLAPDLVGMGQSSPSPQRRYQVVDHARYLDAWFDAVGATKNVTLVLHDWGSALGFHRAARFPDQVRAIAHMEAIIQDRTWAEFGPFEQTFRTLRSPKGEELVLDHDFFVEQVLPHAVLRKLGPDELEHYRAPFRTRASRWPTLIFPREIPVEGQPADVAAIVANSKRYLSAATIPKTFINVVPGTISESARAAARRFPNTKEVTVKGIHYVQEDSPAQIADAVRDLLTRA